MNNLSEQELNEVVGGGLSRAAIATVLAAGIFIVGVFDGFLRPLKCRK